MAKRFWNERRAAISDGDADADGDVDGDDFLIWQSNFGSASGGPAAVYDSGIECAFGSALYVFFAPHFGLFL